MRKALLSSMCQECQQEILPGDDIYPVEGGTGLKRSSLCWLHLACAERLGSPPVPPCKHFLRSGICQYGGSCFFAHPEEAGRLAIERLQLRRSKPNAKIANRGEGRRNGVKNYSKSSVLRRWLLENLGIEQLRSGPVLDVAGGKGELAWELLNLNLVQGVVLDPRPLDLKTVERKWRHGLFWRNPIFHNFLHCTFDGTQEPKVPEHWRLLLTDDLIDSLKGGTEEFVAAFEKSRQKAAELRWTRKGLVHEGEEDQDPEHPEDEVDEVDEVDAVQSSEELPADRGSDFAAMTNCSAVVALHPDQAAEASIRLALDLGKPFAVVPCCVYAAEFPKRKLRSGAPVRSYFELLEYLQQLDPRIQRTNLDFEGKNTLLFMTPQD
eukprot:Skav229445  [mRNA]  locus=scaffold397:229789:230925:+ [translate_table: standard]